MFGGGKVEELKKNEFEKIYLYTLIKKWCQIKKKKKKSDKQQSDCLEKEKKKKKKKQKKGATLLATMWPKNKKKNKKKGNVAAEGRQREKDLNWGFLYKVHLSALFSLHFPLKLGE